MSNWNKNMDEAPHDREILVKDRDGDVGVAEWWGKGFLCVACGYFTARLNSNAYILVNPVAWMEIPQ